MTRRLFAFFSLIGTKMPRTDESLRPEPVMVTPTNNVDDAARTYLLPTSTAGADGWTDLQTIPPGPRRFVRDGEVTMYLENTKPLRYRLRFSPDIVRAEFNSDGALPWGAAPWSAAFNRHTWPRLTILVPVEFWD